MRRAPFGFSRRGNMALRLLGLMIRIFPFRGRRISSFFIPIVRLGISLIVVLRLLVTILSLLVSRNGLRTRRLIRSTLSTLRFPLLPIKLAIIMLRTFRVLVISRLIWSLLRRIRLRCLGTTKILIFAPERMRRRGFSRISLRRTLLRVFIFLVSLKRLPRKLRNTGKIGRNKLKLGDFSWGSFPPRPRLDGSVSSR